MKKFVILLLFVVISMNGYCQIWSSYQDAYNAGYYGMKSRINCINAESALAKGNYEEAMNLYLEAAELNNGDGCEGVGLMVEMGIGYVRNLDLADKYYNMGAKMGSDKCRAAIQRINRNGHYSSSYKSTYLDNLRRQYEKSTNMPIMGGGYVGGGSNYNNSGSSGSTYSSGKNTCPTCHGTGACTYCNGTGSNIIHTYMGDSYKTCIQCYGNKTCRGCGGRGYFY